jgi:hypothetical protein
MEACGSILFCNQANKNFQLQNFFSLLDICIIYPLHNLNILYVAFFLFIPRPWDDLNVLNSSANNSHVHHKHYESLNENNEAWRHQQVDTHEHTQIYCTPLHDVVWWETLSYSQRSTSCKRWRNNMFRSSPIPEKGRLAQHDSAPITHVLLFKGPS